MRHWIDSRQPNYPTFIDSLPVSIHDQVTAYKEAIKLPCYEAKETYVKLPCYDAKNKHKPKLKRKQNSADFI